METFSTQINIQMSIRLKQLKYKLYFKNAIRLMSFEIHSILRLNK